MNHQASQTTLKGDGLSGRRKKRSRRRERETAVRRGNRLGNMKTNAMNRNANPSSQIDFVKGWDGKNGRGI